jgi:hypothetical protein
MTERLNLLSYRRNLRRRSMSKSDYTRWRLRSCARYRTERPQSPPKGVGGRLWEVRHFGKIANSLFQTVSGAAGSGGNRLRSLGRGNGGPAGRLRLKLGVRGRLKEGAGAVSHDQQAAGQQHDILQHEPPAA